MKNWDDWATFTFKSDPGKRFRFELYLDSDKIFKYLVGRAKRSKHKKATALGGGVVVKFVGRVK